MDTVHFWQTLKKKVISLKCLEYAFFSLICVFEELDWFYGVKVFNYNMYIFAIQNIGLM
jgi:hypothetical protein